MLAGQSPYNGRRHYKYLHSVTSSSSPRNNLASIQALRGIAALLVVCMHELFMGFPPPGQFPAPTFSTLWQLKSFGGTGVQIFFVISGFIMAYLAAKDRERSFSSFALDRLTRLAPLYWLTSAYWIAHLAAPDWTFIAKSLLFIPVREFFPVNGVGWTLTMEAFFYVTFGIVVVRLRRSPAWLVAVFGGISVLARLAPHSMILTFYSDPIVWCFVAGIGVYHLHATRLVARLRYVILALALVGFAHAAHGFLPPHVWGPETVIPWDIPSILLVLSVTSIEATDGWPRSILARLMGSIGDASYSLYLSHIITISLLNAPLLMFASRLGIAQPNFMLFVFVAAAVVCSIAVYRFVERPLTRLARHALRMAQRTRHIQVTPSKFDSTDNSTVS
ncbi:acyltransferase [Paraburkholderia fungorum]|uniref:acyltransferase family protein n=1 Tax=Paraburkholderia fungorum TaxID=134537 RepID=UPI0038BD908B